MDPGRNPWTTVSGFVLIMAALALVFVPMFVEVKEKPEWYIEVTLGVVGMALIVAPDDFKSAFRNLIKRKGKEL
jgi:hypothetical protein